MDRRFIQLINFGNFLKLAKEEKEGKLILKDGKNEIVFNKHDFDQQKLVYNFIEKNINITNYTNLLLEQFIPNPDVTDDYYENTLNYSQEVFENENFYKNGREEELDIKNLSFHQETLNYEKLFSVDEKYLENRIFVTKRNDGKMVVEDGLCRVLFSLITGKDKINALVIDLDYC